MKINWTKIEENLEMKGKKKNSNPLKAKIEFKIDGDSVFAHTVDFREDYPIEDDLACLDQFICINEYKRNVTYTADIEITYSESWTDYGMESDFAIDLENVVEKLTNQGAM